MCIIDKHLKNDNMKNIFIVLLMFFAFGLGAQTIHTFTRPTSATLDSVINSGSVALTLTVRSAYDLGAFQVKIAKVSGTVTGTCICAYSVNGTDYTTMSAVGDTLSFTNTSGTHKIWPLADVYYPYYKITCTGSATGVAIASAKAHFKKK